jgi:hypothetical protein
MASGWPDGEPLGQWQESLFWKVPPLAWPEFHLYDNAVFVPLTESAPCIVGYAGTFQKKGGVLVCKLNQTKLRRTCPAVPTVGGL